MKKLFLGLFLFFVLLFPAISQAADTGWTIQNFEVNATINKDRSVDLSEKIEVDFNSLQKHGIYRYMPYKYSRKGNNYNVRIDVKSITDENGKNVNFTESRSGGNLELKIGDADIYITGKNTYNIEYHINRVINEFDDHDEFYWNATGDDWPVDIEKSSINIRWPEGSEIYANECFVGTYGSTEQNCTISETENGINIVSNQVLLSGEGLTVVSGINPGVLEKYSFIKELGWFLADNWTYLIPFVVLIWLISHYHKKGKDPQGRKSVTVEFSPPKKLPPGILGVVHDEKVDTKDISATIIDLAVKGYIKIREIKNKGVFGIESTNYQFTRTEKAKSGLEDYEIKILDAVFGTAKTKKLSSLKNEFYKDLPQINKLLYAKVKSKNYFEEDPQKTRGKYLAIGIVLISVGFFAPAILAAIFGSFGGLLFAFVGSGILFIIFSFLMPRRTREGVEVTDQIKGFKMYMDKAEKYRQKFYEDKKIFEKLLPYAMIFGIATQWAEKFKDMQMDKPDWYEGRGAFYPVVFANNMNIMQNQMNSTFVSRPSSAGSGGSGFSGGGSGGGFGGGGGGSW